MLVEDREKERQREREREKALEISVLFNNEQDLPKLFLVLTIKSYQ